MPSEESEDHDSGVYQFECENGHGWKGSEACRCPRCETGYVYVITEVNDRVPV